MIVVVDSRHLNSLPASLTVKKSPLHGFSDVVRSTLIFLFFLSKNSTGTRLTASYVYEQPLRPVHVESRKSKNFRFTPLDHSRHVGSRSHLRGYFSHLWISFMFLFMGQMCFSWKWMRGISFFFFFFFFFLI